jgi:hypothetical protein
MAVEHVTEEAARFMTARKRGEREREREREREAGIGLAEWLKW